MSLNRDFEDLLHGLNAARAKYLVVGAYAVIFYTEPRYTKDLDIWVEPTAENAEKVLLALKRFGAPVEELTLKDLTNPTTVFQIGLEPNRVDILTGIGALPFKRAWRNKTASRYGKEKCYFIGWKDLLQAKKEAGRLHDQIDAERLSRVKPSRKR